MKTLLLLEVTKDYIQLDQQANQRACSLIYFIDQFDYAMNAIDMDHEYDKWLRNIIYDFVLGIDYREKSVDDFSDIFNKAYCNSLLKYKIKNSFKNMK
ncbi:hypothetical protein [Legionella impletisoli]|uniref:Uncharacterized protein n=1 Tax=Legionella impletisoli TaxID=343510 RepID=A0A917JR44_9GAMM|nr:hypothetical protein [Legionella impletisoli]GGI82465.1 hypothetical protein GCM10007966_08820 [Legionella impletisoli]